MSEEPLRQTYVRLRSKNPKGGWFVHPDLRPKIVADATAQGTNMGDVVAQILCRHYGVPYEPKARKTSPATSADQIVFSMPESVFAKLCANFPGRYQDGLRGILCAHYGLPMPAKVKLPRRRRAVAA